MTVRVDIVGYARDIFDRPSYLLEARPGMTVRDLFKVLSEHSGTNFDREIYDLKSGRMNEHIAAFVNSREIRSLEGLDTKLKDGDVITILPPMAGG